MGKKGKIHFKIFYLENKSTKTGHLNDKKEKEKAGRSVIRCGQECTGARARDPWL